MHNYPFLCMQRLGRAWWLRAGCNVLAGRMALADCRPGQDRSEYQFQKEYAGAACAGDDEQIAAKPGRDDAGDECSRSGNG